MNEHETGEVQAPQPPESYELVCPITLAGQEVRELRFRPTARAFRGFEQKVSQSADGITVTSNPYAAAVVACKMAGQPEAFADQLHPADMVALSGIALSFLAAGPPTGRTPSR